ncbi:hypothetical protein BJ508DRAFT_331857 [Ascobolus immersus RN42]|uniref:Uncharacterized protein n=1 Tax=Ascobolus immersus RN42 TaxID=1160509 RepID=A0A3N4I191_ASCIM|nr:hypothetical protein BJ508DRAFT_331857 [Ascobolus immersus RN42]
MRKEQEYKRMLEKKNKAKVKALRKIRAVLSTKEIKVIAISALEVPFVAGAFVDDSVSVLDDETVYEYSVYLQEFGEEHDDYEDSDANSNAGSEDEEDQASDSKPNGASGGNGNVSDGEKSSDDGWEIIMKEVVAPAGLLSLPAPVAVLRSWFFIRN